MWKKIKQWLDDRVGINDLVTTKFRNFMVPRDANILSGLGGVALIAFLVQVISGILLIMYYVPHPDHAFRSVQVITDQVQFGWLFRMVHVVGANFLVAILLLHIAVVFYRSNFQKPRELVWVSGVFSFFVILAFCVSGSLLPWNQISYWSTTVITSIPSVIPGIGELLSKFLKGGQTVSGITLSRFFAFHVAILPFTIGVIGGLHLLFVRRSGLAPSLQEEPLPYVEFRHEIHPNGKPFYPGFFTTQLGASMLYMAAIFFVISFMPSLFFLPDSYIQANPLQTPLNIDAPYYFRAFRTILAIVPHEFTGVCIQLIILTLFTLWPFIDFSEERRITKRPILFSLYCAAIFGWLAFTFWGRI